jgi:hypothetical protein
MRKICEIDSIKLFSENPTGCWYAIRQPTCLSRLKNDQLEIAFTPAQLKFLENRHAVLRPHPKHNPTLELFIDETDLDSRDWTMLYLIF